MDLMLWRAGSNWWQHSGEPCPDSTVELTLAVGVWVSQSLGQECGRADAATHLPWGDTGSEVATSSSRESGPQSPGKLTLPPTSCSTWEKCPAPHLNSTAELTLVAGVGEEAHR